MRVSLTPERLDVIPGVPQQLSIAITNPGTVIGGYTVRVLGADPSWVEIEEQRVSLFPDETRVVTATVTVPPGLAAGERRMAVQVRELTPPERSVVEELVLVVPEAPNSRVRLDPLSLTMGRTGRFSLLIENAGNTPVVGWLAADDSESKLKTRFDPRQIELAPGEHVVADMRVKGKRPFAGAPAVRQLSVHLVEGQPLGNAGPGPSLEVPGRKKADPYAPPDPEAQPAAVATVLQKAMLSRGPIGLVGLLAAITIFAIVITLALSRIVGQSAQDRNLALEIAAAREQAQTGGSSALSGTVRELTSGRPVKGVAVDVFAADDLVDPVASLATGANGTYRINGLSAGDYKITYRGAGFEPLWFPSALDAENGEVVKVEERNRVAGLDVNLGGTPAMISGVVNGDDVEDASVSLRIPAPTIATDPTSPGGQVGVGAIGDPDDDGAIVDTVPVGTDGRFAFASVPSPSEYDVVVTKEGYATAVQRVDVSAGEERKGVELNLRKGDGLISGTVVSDGAPIEGVTLTATSGESSVSSVSLKDGSFTLRQLPTPATYTLVATKDGLRLPGAEPHPLRRAEAHRGRGQHGRLGRLAERPDHPGRRPEARRRHRHGHRRLADRADGDAELARPQRHPARRGRRGPRGHRRRHRRLVGLGARAPRHLHDHLLPRRPRVHHGLGGAGRLRPDHRPVRRGHRQLQRHPDRDAVGHRVALGHDLPGGGRQRRRGHRRPSPPARPASPWSRPRSPPR